MPPEVGILRIIWGLALALFRIPIDRRRTAEYNSNSLVVTHNSLRVQTIIVQCMAHASMIQDNRLKAWMNQVHLIIDADVGCCTMRRRYFDQGDVWYTGNDGALLSSH
jgi:hypothetical protein